MPKARLLVRIIPQLLFFIFAMMLMSPIVVLSLIPNIYWTFYPQAEFLKTDEEIRSLFGKLNERNLLVLIFGFAQHPGASFHEEFRRRKFSIIFVKLISAFIIWPGIIWSTTLAGLSLADEWDDVYGPKEWLLGILLWGMLIAGLTLWHGL